MNKVDGMREIRARWREIMAQIAGVAPQPVNGAESYICACGHGTHGDGISYNAKVAKMRPGEGYENQLHCFGCGFTGSVIDYYLEKVMGCLPVGEMPDKAGNMRPVYSTADVNRAVSDLAEILGIEVNLESSGTNTLNSANAGNVGNKSNIQTISAARPAAKAAPTSNGAQNLKTANYMSYYTEAAKHIEDPEAVKYLAARGISLETAKRYNLGYDPAADPGTLPGVWGDDPQKKHPVRRIICPVNGQHYVGRAMDPNTAKDYKSMNANGSTPGIFNVNVLWTGTDPVFITEGFFTALSYIEVGARAIATCSASNTDTLIHLLEERPPMVPLVVAFDNDKAGREAKERVTLAAKRLNLQCHVAPAPVIGEGDTAEGKEDANDLLRKNREAFAEEVEKMIKAANSRPDLLADYLESAFLDDLEKFNAVRLNTGFKVFDTLTGGIRAGLYVIGAISSLGKTTFCIQIADNIAAAGNDVLYFSLEQSRLEVVTTCLSRRTYQLNTQKASTSLQIRDNSITDRATYSKALKEFRDTAAGHLSVIECNFGCDRDYIRAYVERYIKQNHTRPIVFIDYLQIVPDVANQTGKRNTDMQVVDDNVTAFKMMSRDLNIPVVVISSVNRENYLAPIDFEAFKQSGKIEYSADVVLGMQLTQVEASDLFESDKDKVKKRKELEAAKLAIPRRVMIKGLKNRFGATRFFDCFKYDPRYSVFWEVQEAKLSIEGPTK